jgi:hypothetical protein
VGDVTGVEDEGGERKRAGGGAEEGREANVPRAGSRGPLGKAPFPQGRHVGRRDHIKVE